MLQKTNFYLWKLQFLHKHLFQEMEICCNVKDNKPDDKPVRAGNLAQSQAWSS